MKIRFQRIMVFQDKVIWWDDVKMVLHFQVLKTRALLYLRFFQVGTWFSVYGMLCVQVKIEV